MVSFDGNSHLDYLYQKLLRQQHHRENYVTSLLEEFISKLLRIKKRPAFETVTELLLKESENVIAKIEIEIETELQKGEELSQGVKREGLEQRLYN